MTLASTWVDRSEQFEDPAWERHNQSKIGIVPRESAIATYGAEYTPFDSTP